MTHDARAIFNAYAEEYDAYRRVCIPCFDDFYQCVLDLLPPRDSRSFHVLDLGAGTGILANFIHHAYPQATVTLVDVAEQMLEQAQQRFTSAPQIRYLVADYSQAALPGDVDVIVSALSIHHLSDERKRALYGRIYQALRPDGLFINADLVLGATPGSEQRNREIWVRKMRDLGMTDAAYLAWEERSRLDQFAHLSAQLNWLNQSGFRDVDCFYKYFNFAVFAGVK